MYTYLVCSSGNQYSCYCDLPVALFDTLTEVSNYCGRSKYTLSRGLIECNVFHMREYTVYRFLTKELL